MFSAAKRSRLSPSRELVKRSAMEKTSLLLPFEMLLITGKPTIKFLSLRIQ